MEFHTRTMNTLQRQGQGTFGIFALRFLLVSVAFMSYKAGVDALVMTRNDRYHPADEHVTVNEGEKLVMHCSASSYYLRYVWWGKQSFTNPAWLTKNSNVDTDDSRVSVVSSTFRYQGRDYNAYSIRITDVTTSDSGKYRCSVTWGDDSSRGFVFVTVNYFPQEEPVCSTNEADASSVNDIDVRCDTADGNPQVNITWTVQETGEEVSSTIHDHNLGGQARRLSQLRLRQELRNHILVCTVTSSAFPGQNQTCLVDPIVVASSVPEEPREASVSSMGTVKAAHTTNGDVHGRPTAHTTSGIFVGEINIVTELPPVPAGTSSDKLYPSSAIFASGIITATDLPPTRAVTDETQTAYIAAAVGIPAAFFVGLLVSLACTRKRQQGDKRRSNEPRRETATPDAGHQPSDMELMAVPYLVTKVRDETMPSASRDDDVTGTRVSVHAYETRIGPAEDTDSAAYEQVDRDIGENEVTSSYLELQ